MRFAARLEQIEGVLVCPSACNFLLVEIAGPSLSARLVYQELGRRGLLVRACDCFMACPRAASFGSPCGLTRRITGWRGNSKHYAPGSLERQHEGDFGSGHLVQQRQELAGDRVVRVVAPQGLEGRSIQGAEHVQ